MRRRDVGQARKKGGKLAPVVSRVILQEDESGELRGCFGKELNE